MQKLKAVVSTYSRNAKNKRTHAWNGAMLIKYKT